MQDATRKRSKKGQGGLAGLLMLMSALDLIVTFPRAAAIAATPTTSAQTEMNTARHQLATIQSEAENASYICTLIGPNYTFTTLPSQASGREAVQLAGQG